MAEEKLMTEAEFDVQLRKWADNVQSLSEKTLRAGTHGSGKLEESLIHYVDAMKDKKGRHIAFRFEPYGVFRQYGAGRGWVVVNGVPVPGYRVVSLKDRSKPKNWGSAAKQMLSLGYRRPDVSNAKQHRNTPIKKERTPLDWLDGRIQASFGQLANIAQQYWGDIALQALDQQLQKVKIVKKSNNSIWL